MWEVGVVTFFRFGGPIRSYDTGRSFDPIFTKFTWLMRVHPWVNPIVFGNNRPNRTTYMGENVPQNQYFGFKLDGMGFFEKKNLKTIFGTPFTKKEVIFISVVRPPPSLKKVTPLKKFFRLYFGKYCFFRKSCKIKNIQNFDNYRKGYIDFCRLVPPSPQNGHALPQMRTSKFSPKIPLFSKNLFYNKISGT